MLAKPPLQDMQEVNITSNETDILVLTGNNNNAIQYTSYACVWGKIRFSLYADVTVSRLANLLDPATIINQIREKSQKEQNFIFCMEIMLTGPVHISHILFL